MDVIDCNEPEVSLGIAFFQFERGKRAGSPISDDMLPMISPPGAKADIGVSRISADSLSIPTSSNARSYTHVVIFAPMARSTEYDVEDFSVFFRLEDEELGEEIV